MLFSRILTFVSLAIVGSCGVAAMANPVTTVVKRQTTVTALLGTLAGGVETEVATICASRLAFLSTHSSILKNWTPK